MAATWEQVQAGALGKTLCKDCGELEPLNEHGRCFDCANMQDWLVYRRKGDEQWEKAAIEIDEKCQTGRPERRRTALHRYY